MQTTMGGRVGVAPERTVVLPADPPLVVGAVDEGGLAVLVDDDGAPPVVIVSAFAVVSATELIDGTAHRA